MRSRWPARRKMMIRRVLSAVVLALLAIAPYRAHAQTVTLTVTYPAGWNMIGAPPGTDLTALGTLYVWTGTQYASPGSHTAAECTGYWSDQLAPSTVTLASAPASPQVCLLRQGWNLVGDPFADAATLPSDVLAYTLPAGATT